MSVVSMHLTSNVNEITNAESHARKKPLLSRYDKIFSHVEKNSLFQEIYIAGHHMIETDLIRDVAKSQLLAEKELITSSN